MIVTVKVSGEDRGSVEALAANISAFLARESKRTTISMDPSLAGKESKSIYALDLDVVEVVVDVVSGE